MTDYSDDLVELGNQAWILNCALAELYRFRGCVEQQIQTEPQRSRPLQQGMSAHLDPAIARLSVRLEALMAKWTRRMAEQSAEADLLLVHAEPWGCRVELPAWVRQRLQVDQETMTQAEAESLTARHPEQFFVFHAAPESKEADTQSERRLAVTRYQGVPLNVARMWWCWIGDRPEPCCRLQAVTANLWEMDACGGLEGLTRD